LVAVYLWRQFINWGRRLLANGLSRLRRELQGLGECLVNWPACDRLSVDFSRWRVIDGGLHWGGQDANFVSRVVLRQ
jgi:hypothetical protein